MRRVPTFWLLVGVGASIAFTSCFFVFSSTTFEHFHASIGGNVIANFVVTIGRDVPDSHGWRLLVGAGDGDGCASRDDDSVAEGLVWRSFSGLTGRNLRGGDVIADPGAWGRLGARRGWTAADPAV